MEAKFYKKPKKAVVINSNKQYDTYSKAFISLKFKNKEKNYKHLSNGTELSVLGFIVHEYELNTRCYKCVTNDSVEILIRCDGIKFIKDDTKKYYMIATEENNKCQKTYAYVCVKSTDTINSKGVNHKGEVTKKYNTLHAIKEGVEITKEEFLIEYNKAKALKKKKGKLTIVVSKNYKELYEDNIALVNHILLYTVRGDFEWMESVQKSNLNITLYTDKNDTELFKKSFGKFEVKLMDAEELVSGWYKNGNFLMYHNFDTDEKYGFCHDNFWTKGDLKASEGHIDNCVLATHEEVEERLKEEAIKRGFKEGVKVRNHQRGDRELINFSLENIKYSEKYHIGIYLTTGTGTWLMMDGVWAEIVEEKLTLENIQVDCSELTTEQIEEMKRVVVDNGFKLWDDSIAFEIIGDAKYFQYNTGTFCILTKMDYLTTITYDKLMELFNTKKEECNNNLKGLVLVSHKGVDKSRLQEPEYVEQMIKEGKILHVENFNKSLVMDNGSTISNVKEGEVKSIEELHVEHKEQNSIGKSYNKKHLHLEEPVFNPQSHYNNEFGSLYKMSEQLGLNTYEFDILKRVVRCRKKGQFEEDLQKTKDLIDLYLIESKK